MVVCLRVTDVQCICYGFAWFNGALDVIPFV